MGTSAFIPNGSYQLTVRGIQVTLSCNAQKRDQSWAQATLDLTNLTQADIANIDGTLQNTGGAAPINGFVPGGSYQQTCNNVAVLLQCQAQKIDQSWVPATLDLTKLSRTADIANMDGRLLDMAQVNAAFGTVGQMFPDLQPTLQANQAAITQYAINGTKPTAAAPPPAAAPASPAASTSGTIFSPCTDAVGYFLVDVAFFVLGVMGIRVVNNERIARSILQELGQDTINGLRAAVHNFYQAQNMFDKARRLFSIVTGFLNVTTLKNVLAEVRDQMTFWDWAKAAVLSVAQLTAWFATDGVAFVAEVVIVLSQTPTLIASAENAYNACASG